MRKLLRLECAISDDRDVTITVLDGHEQELWMAQFRESQLEVTDEDDAPGGWSPNDDNPMAKMGQVIGRVMGAQHPKIEQLDMLLHIALHNMLDAARAALREAP